MKTSELESILRKSVFSREDLVGLLGLEDPEQVEVLRETAERRTIEQCGTAVHYRGLIEFSNFCTCDCFYCGIRKGNTSVTRFTLEPEKIISAALWSAQQGYGSLVLQSGERQDEAFISFVEDITKEIKKRSRSERLPNGLGITLCVGEQNKETLQRFFDAGAHRYLLRIETSSPQLFQEIHPPSQQLKSRIRCLSDLREVGFQVGTGVMIGLPGQTLEDLADDIMFFREMDIDMIGMGPYIVHSDTPMAQYEAEIASKRDWIFDLALKMIACVRLELRDVNIAATTALQAMRPDGREEGIRFGANIIMPQLTPTEVRGDYLLYEGKPCLDENAMQCRSCLERRIKSVGRTVAVDSWGDSLHAKQRKDPAPLHHCREGEQAKRE